MYRDFSEKSRLNLLSLVEQVENEKYSDFTDWFGDRWYDFQSWIGQLNIKNYISNVNTYHKKVIDKNNTTEKAINNIFSAVKSVDNSYSEIFKNSKTLLDKWGKYVLEMSYIVLPSNGVFSTQYMGKRLNNIIDSIEDNELVCLRDRMIQNLNGELIFNEDLIYEYVKKNPAQMTDREKALVLEVISKLKETVTFYETAASLDADKWGADFITHVAWLSESTQYESFTGVSAHYNKIFVNLLNFMSEQSSEQDTFAASLINVGVGESVLSMLGLETSENIKDIFGVNTFKAFLTKYTTEHTEHYFGKLELSEKDSLKLILKHNKLNDAIEDFLKEKGLLFKSDSATEYYDLDGNPVDKKEFYKKELELLKYQKNAEAKVSLYDGSYDLGDWGNVDVTVGEAKADASFTAGLYVIGADGKKKFSPGVSAEVGASVTAFEVGWENQLLGDENLGLNADAKVTVGEASAKADATAQIYGEDGKLDIQLGASASAEAIAAEAEGSVGVNVLGGEVGVTGSVNIGVGAHVDVGYQDGVFKFDVGASLGIGASVSVEVDVGGMVDTVCDVGKAAWDFVTFWD